MKMNNKSKNNLRILMKFVLDVNLVTILHNTILLRPFFWDAYTYDGGSLRVAFYWCFSL